METTLLGQGQELAFKNTEAKGPVSRLDAADQSGLQVGPKSRLHLGQLGGGPISGQHHAPAILDQSDQGVEQLFLGLGLAGHKVDVVDQQ